MTERRRIDGSGTRAAPTIGVTGPDRGGLSSWFFIRFALRRCGARALRITPARPVDGRMIDGLVLGGGADVTVPVASEPEAPPEREGHLGGLERLVDDLVAPVVFAVRRAAGNRRHGIDTRRDTLELSLIRDAKRRNLPVLGICRGAQLMNIAEGGTLLSDLRTLYEERSDVYTVLPRRRVDVLEASRLSGIVGCRSLFVNSLHFHAIDRPGGELRVVAREPNGVAQAIEDPGRRFWIGVQWHPEYLPQRSAHLRLFRELVECARTQRVRRHGAERFLHTDSATFGTRQMYMRA